MHFKSLWIKASAKCINVNVKHSKLCFSSHCLGPNCSGRAFMGWAGRGQQPAWVGTENIIQIYPYKILAVF